MSTQLTLDMLLQTFERYNTTLSPWTWIIYSLGVVVVLLAFWPSPTVSRLISGLLGILWLWSGAAFFLYAFAPVYPPAYVFGALFIVQGLAFLYTAWRGTLAFGFRVDLYGVVGLVLALYALLGYIIVGDALGHRLPQAAIVGAPCPATVLTFGLLLMTRERVPWPLLVIPALWAVGGVLPVSTGIGEDVGLVVGGVAATALILYRDRRPATRPEIRPAH